LKQQKAAASTPSDEAKTETPKPAAGGKKGKKGPGGAAAAAARARMEQMKQEQEALAIIEAERERQAREQELMEAEEEMTRKLLRDAKAKEKAEERAKLRAEGLLVSKGEQERQQKRELARQKLKAAGMLRDEEETKTGGDMKQAAKEKKKKKQEEKRAQAQREKEAAAKKAEEDRIQKLKDEEEAKKLAEVEKKQAEKDAAAAAAKKAEGDNLDWEDLADDSTSASVLNKRHEEDKTLEAERAKAIEAALANEAKNEALDLEDEEGKRAKRINKRITEKELEEINKVEEGMRCPIVCILGHVDTGKTKLLDKIRSSNVQGGEAGGITQQIGATYFPPSKLDTEMRKLKGTYDVERKIPGLLIIDTPGHESFTNLRSRGSSLCDFAILVIDIMHGLEKQTLESLQLLRQRKTPFIVALNKIDRCYEWKSKPYNSFRDSLNKQKGDTRGEFRDRTDQTIAALAGEGINAVLYYDNNDPREWVSLVPTSAITGEGIPDILTVITDFSQKYLKKRLQIKAGLQCTVLEVKVIEGLGTTIDVILVNGVLKEGDTIVLCGFNGPIVTTIRALLTPEPMKELRVKNEYVHHKFVKASQGLKISAHGLEDAIAGSQLLVADTEEDVDGLVEETQRDLENVLNKIEKSVEGVCVQASTLGSLEALLEFLRTSKIPVSNVAIGPVHKKDVMKAMKANAQVDSRKEYATILAFDVKIHPDAQEYADQNDVTVFSADIIYHLFDQFTEYVKKIRDEEKNLKGKEAVFPCLLRIVPNAIFRNRDPIILGVDVVAGVLRVGTPLAVPDAGNLKIGFVESIEMNHKHVNEVRPGAGSASVKIASEGNIMAGRHFTEKNQLVSYMTRNSIDALKQYFKDEMTTADWKLVIQLKKVFDVL